MGAREGLNDPVMVPAGVLEGLEAVRRSGAHLVERAFGGTGPRAGLSQTHELPPDRPLGRGEPGGVHAR